MTPRQFEWLQMIAEGARIFTPEDMRTAFKKAGQGHVGPEYIQRTYVEFVDSPLLFATSRRPIEAGKIFLEAAYAKAKKAPEVARRKAQKQLILHPYMAYSQSMGAEEGAELIFAHTLQEAKGVAWNSTAREIVDSEYIDLAVKRLRDHAEYLLTLADPAKREKGIPHAIDNPPSCSECWTWGRPLTDSICALCAEEIAFEKRERP
jgi:hypothetical protein